MVIPRLVFGATAAVALVWGMPAWADKPSAIVEAIAVSDTNLEFMEYVEAGRVIKLGSTGSITLGYLRSCWRETISGGTVTVGTKKSTVVGGTVQREWVECDGGAIELRASEAVASAGMVFREQLSAQSARLPEPEITLYGTSPFIILTEHGGNVIIERLDETDEVIVIKITGTFVDLAIDTNALEPGGLYVAHARAHSVVFKVDPSARPGAGPIIGRLIQF